LPDTGTYTVSVGGADAEDSYDLTIAQLPYLRETAKAGQARTPALTRIDPAKGVAGRTTTVTIFGKQMAKPTAVHIVKSGVELPATVAESHAVLGSSESPAAVVRVDIPANASTGDYTVRVDMADGRTVQLQNASFSVAASADPAQAVVSMNGFDRLRYGAVNRAYVNITNPTDADFLSVPVIVDLPPTTGDVTLVSPAHDFNSVANFLVSKGAAEADVASIRSLTDVTRAHPQIDANGMRTFLVFVPRLAAHATVSMTFEMIPVEPPPIFVGTATRQPTVSVMTPRTSALERADEGVPCMAGESSGTGDVKPPGLDPVEDPWRDFMRDLVKNLLGQSIPDGPEGDLALDMIAAALAALTWYFAADILAVAIPAILYAVAGLMMFVAPPIGATIAAALIAAAGAIEAEAIAALIEYFTKRAALAVLALGAGHLIHAHFCRSYDPNALTGPGDPTKMSTPPGTPDRYDGGAVHVGQRAYYKTEFENDGTAPAQMIDVDAHVAQQLDWSTFELDEVWFGAEKVDLSPEVNNPWHQHADATVPINNSTTTLSVDSVFNPNSTFDPSTGLEPGELHVTFAGPNAEDDQYHPSPHGDVLPPGGQGSFRFSAKVLDLTPNTTVDQGEAKIQFDPHLIVPPDAKWTNSWQNTIVLENGLLGVALKLSDNALNPSAKGVKAKLQGDALRLFADPTKPGQPTVTLRVLSEAGDSTYSLRATSGVWRASYSSAGPRLFKYTGATGSPIRSVTIDVAHGKVNIVGRGAALTHSLATAMPSAVDVVITEGSQQFCSHFGGIVQTLPGRYFKGKKAPAPSSCPA
jgi:hypothetical protein